MSKNYKYKVFFKSICLLNIFTLSSYQKLIKYQIKKTGKMTSIKELLSNKELVKLSKIEYGTFEYISFTGSVLKAANSIVLREAILSNSNTEIIGGQGYITTYLTTNPNIKNFGIIETKFDGLGNQWSEGNFVCHLNEEGYPIKEYYNPNPVGQTI